MNTYGVTRMRNTTINRNLAAAGEIVLSPFSFICYKATRAGVRRIAERHGGKYEPLATQWRPLDGQAIAKPFDLLVPMTLGPRWNTHALIALAGPLQVQRMLRINAATAANSAESWTVAVHALPTYRTVASVGSLKSSGAEPWQTVELGPGTYRLALRYYNWHDGAELPPVEVDGAPAVSATAVPAGINDFYHSLSERSNFFYLCMHSYVCTLLRYHRFFPHSFVQREYLPAGNPQTTFYYGFLQAGTRLGIELDPGLLQTHDVYFTTYNRASFPILWYPLLETSHTTAVVRVSGSYLIRVHAKTKTQEAGGPDRIRVRALPAAPPPPT